MAVSNEGKRMVEIFPRYAQDFFPHSQKHLTGASCGIRSIEPNFHSLFSWTRRNQLELNIYVYKKTNSCCLSDVQLVNTIGLLQNCCSHFPYAHSQVVIPQCWNICIFKTMNGNSNSKGCKPTPCSFTSPSRARPTLALNLWLVTSSPHCWITESGCYDRADAKSTKSIYNCKKIQPKGLTALWPRTNLFYFFEFSPFQFPFPMKFYANSAIHAVICTEKKCWASVFGTENIQM